MSNLKELTWEHHKNAERQAFVKEIMGGKITNERYATYLYNPSQYDILEAMAMIPVFGCPHAQPQVLWQTLKNYGLEEINHPICSLL